MCFFRFRLALCLAWMALVASFSIQAEDHPWVTVANTTVFAQRLIEHRDAHGWADLRLSLFEDSKYAYEHRLPIAERLLYSFLWMDLMYEKESDYVTEWVDKMEAANRLRANMPAQIPYYDGVLGDRLGDPFLKYFFSRGDLLRAAYNQWDPSDLLTEVFSILDQLYSSQQYMFTQYTELAFAIAFVHDVPPPPVWPHPQVGENVLPRQLQAPEVVFEYFTNSKNTKWFHSSLKRLPLSEAIFLVDLIVTPAEVEWVKENVTVSVEKYDEVYTMVRYDTRRLQAGLFHWPYDDYSLGAIYQSGGICVDQAYFASQVGKIQGLPTIEFLGSGLDGRHAWFGYLDPNGKWEMDAGRYADQQFVTGLGFNPQTWTFISDHKLAFLGARYQKSQAYYSSQVHYYWARLLSSLDQVEQAEKAAANAVAVDRRNAEAWSLLIQLRKRLGISRAGVDASYRSALSALRIYTDLEARFISEYATYLESTGRENSARLERSRITFKNKDNRSDLAIKNAAELLNESISNDSSATQMYVFKRILYQLGAQGGIQVLDELVYPFIAHLLDIGRVGDAKSVVLEAEKVLQPVPGSQLSKELQKLKSQIGL